ncbi:helix-turn-helix transcriptional regulator [Neobacillus niacini]|uniref:helix-turn-helix domain-containing protein n=1 Tax=Neobacillus niacini TaxID=86668 RepID=UPI00285E21DD|nr:helix-turn-helix transcriptional regulator [Neobacillus niacini]MDR6997766.1 DNA-binding Xre family transcriptional regulator [Neobacillus niacini]
MKQYTIVPKLNRILAERKMSQTELSELTGIPQPSISRFDRNTKHMDMHLVMISRALGLTIEDLFEIKEAE